MADHVLLEAGDDLVRQLSHEREAVKAVLELVWNSLDADATKVDVVIERAGTTGVDKIVITDDGDGITPEKARTAFKQVGNSDKRVGGATDRLGRPLHGKAGRGRLRAFALGDSTRWTSTARAADGAMMRTRIESDIRRRTTWAIDCQRAAETDHPGTKVELWGKQAHHLNKLLEPKAVTQITAALAPYLLTWTDVQVTYEGQCIDPQTQIHAEEFEDLSFDYEGQSHPFHIRLIHWRTGAERTIALCDDASAPVESFDVSAEHADFSYTAYVLWAPMPQHRNEVHLITLGGDTPLAALLRVTREWISTRLEERRRRQRRQLVDRWIEEGVYPYPRRAEDDQARAEQATFDLVATSINRHITGDRTKKRLTLSLLQNSLRHNPDQMVEILERVLSLSGDDVSHLHGLLHQTSLSNIIRASSIVTSRLQFLTALEHLVFDVETYGAVKERDHLHKILERELWVFGEEFNMMRSSEIGLTRMLEHHRRAVGWDPTPDAPVRAVDGGTRRVDLMLSAESHEHDRVRHLVIELKAPSVDADREQALQVDDYMQAVLKEPRFANIETTWDFYLVVRSVKDRLKPALRQANKPEGLYSEPTQYEHTSVRVWVRTWSEILREAKQRLEFVKNGIDHNSSLEEALAYLRHRHGDLIPDQLRQPTAVPAPRADTTHHPAV
ncbi:ATP-binding protein [Streptomyces albidoflavus]|uniref:ATP-binding protein n=1 Tax=Streptomyces albidoflavus TaxID=1886 RepID=UPI0013EE6453|nr:ATP-binding protein [Streptomyces albidoflavus]MBV7652723.1 ATP-binding protein [Streptomyces albidoflavus]MBV7714192.1 ATP-binding protein [Streptomyces albidoflavus]